MTRTPARRLAVPLAAAAATAAIALGTLAATTGGPAMAGRSTGAGSGAGAAATGPSITRQAFGRTAGHTVYRYTLTNGRGMRVRILTYGGVVQTVEAPDRNGRTGDVVLGFPTLKDYVAYNSPAKGGGTYFGALVGRYANRIAKGRFTLDGKRYQVPVNNNGNSLHGGKVGFSSRLWTPAGTTRTADRVSLALRLVSRDGDQGYPGTLTTTATYTLDTRNRLSLHFGATTDAPTVVNLTNHTYWNLAGEASGTIYDQRLRIPADRYTPTDATQIPTGRLAGVGGTPMDFRRSTAIGARVNSHFEQLLLGQGYDHNWVLNRRTKHGLDLAAQVKDPGSGRVLTITTTQPGIQFYSGNFLTGTLVGTSGHTYRQSYGYALETQHFPDSPNQPRFPSTVLRPGQTYDETTVWTLGVS